MDSNEHVSDWLRDAHAMEMQALQMLEAQAARLERDLAGAEAKR
jgi:ferritin-like metal-binding protein YciE